ncbi:MAG: hypothetical protein ABFC98_07980 [Candidatus Cloacimonas sp.]
MKFMVYRDAIKTIAYHWIITQFAYKLCWIHSAICNIIICGNSFILLYPANNDPFIVFHKSPATCFVNDKLQFWFCATKSGPKNEIGSSTKRVENMPEYSGSGLLLRITNLNLLKNQVLAIPSYFSVAEIFR